MTKAQELTYKESRANDGQRVMNQYVNRTIQMKPSSYPSEIYPRSSSAAATGSQLPNIACPPGTIPILRNNKCELMESLSFSMTDEEEAYGMQAGLRIFDEIYGARAAINIYEPEVNGKDELSASWVVLFAPGRQIEGVSAGSIV
ncbi:hypothetical protein ACP70R_035463 [Stipagrostis hirtigluma subsp. patula]